MSGSIKLKHPYNQHITDIVKQGNVKMKSRKMGIWKNYWVVLRKPSSRGALRLEKYLTEKEFTRRDNDEIKKVIPLYSISSVELTSSDSRRNCLTIWCSTCSKADVGVSISADSEYEIISWCEVIQEVQQLYGKHYEEFLAEDKFNVLLLPSPLLPFSGEYILRVTDHNIVVMNPQNDDATSNFVSPGLSSIHTQEPVVVWPLTALRKYGRDDTKFTIESGRSCTTGEGLYIFHSHQAELIYQRVHRASLTLATAPNDYTKRSSTYSSDGPTICRRQTIHTNSPQKIEKEKSSTSGVNIFRRSSTKSRRPLPPLPSVADLEISRH